MRAIFENNQFVLFLELNKLTIYLLECVRVLAHLSKISKLLNFLDSFGVLTSRILKPGLLVFGVKGLPGFHLIWVVKVAIFVWNLQIQIQTRIRLAPVEKRLDYVDFLLEMDWISHSWFPDSFEMDGGCEGIFLSVLRDGDNEAVAFDQRSNLRVFHFIEILKLLFFFIFIIYILL